MSFGCKESRSSSQSMIPETVNKLLKRVCHLQACDCSWLFGLRGQLGQLLAAAAREPGGAARLPCLMSAAADGARVLRHCRPPPEPQVWHRVHSLPTSASMRHRGHLARCCSGQQHLQVLRSKASRWFSVSVNLLLVLLQALDQLMRDALEAAVLAPAASAVEADLRLALFAADAAGDGGLSDVSAEAQAGNAAADAASEARWVAPLATLPPMRLATSTLHIRCSICVQKMSSLPRDMCTGLTL